MSNPNVDQPSLEHQHSTARNAQPGDNGLDANHDLPLSRAVGSTYGTTRVSDRARAVIGNVYHNHNYFYDGKHVLDAQDLNAARGSSEYALQSKAPYAQPATWLTHRKRSSMSQRSLQIKFRIMMLSMSNGFAVNNASQIRVHGFFAHANTKPGPRVAPLLS